MRNITIERKRSRPVSKDLRRILNVKQRIQDELAIV